MTILYAAPSRLFTGRPVGADCAFTNRKIIAARSYVRQLAFEAPQDPVHSRPDDYSPRDRLGHGTAVAMVAAGQTSTGPSATITGMAPKAWLGNYKVFGSPGVNDFASDDAVIMALEDALKDGMDIASISLGAPALAGPLDGNDPETMAIENAVRLGMTVVVAAGNDGDLVRRASLCSLAGDRGSRGGGARRARRGAARRDREAQEAPSGRRRARA